MTTTEAGYRIAEVAERTGFPAATLRYYEQIGLLPAPGRSDAGYRIYRDRDVERLRFVDRAKQLGCTLEEIGELARAWEDDRCGPVHHRLRALVSAKLVETQTRIAELSSFADDLRRTAVALAGQPVDGPCDDACACMTAAEARSPVPIALSAHPIGGR